MEDRFKKLELTNNQFIGVVNINPEIDMDNEHAKYMDKPTEEWSHSLAKYNEYRKQNLTEKLRREHNEREKV